MGEATINARIGGSYNPKWADTVPGTAEPYAAIQEMRRTVGSVVESAEKVRHLPPEKRALTLDRLAKSGQTALKRVEELAKRREAIDAARSALTNEVRQDLATIPNIPNTNFASAQIRDYIRTMRKGERSKALSEALGDVEAVRAILGAPPMASGLSTEDWQHFRLRAIHKYLPHVAEQTRVLELAARFFDSAVKNAVQMTAEASGLKKNSAGEWVPEWELG